MIPLRGLHALLPAVVLLAGIAATAAAEEALLAPGEQPQYASVWLQPGLGLATPATPALLGLPAGWMSGDAIVVLTPRAPSHAPWRDALVSALMQAGAGVLELGRAHAADRTADLAAALEVASRDVGAGLVVLIGHGPEEDATLRAAATAPSAAGGSYAAVLRLGADAPVMRFAAAQAAETWPFRAALLCDLLTQALPAEAAAHDPACRAGLAALH